MKDLLASKAFREIREMNGYSRPQVANKSGVPFYLVRNFEERKGRQPTNEQIIRLMEIVRKKK